MVPGTHLRTIGTRGSALARWQTDWVRHQLQAAWPGLELAVRIYATSGDQQLDRPLPEIGGKGVFTQELEDALRAGEIDLAVHSLKDLPVAPSRGLALGAIAVREDARDVLISGSRRCLADLPEGARVGTSSLRRAAQLLAIRPDLKLAPLRGNIDTRIQKALRGDYDAIVLAAAGVLRLGLAGRIVEYLPFEVMLPAPGQGALAVQCRLDDAPVRHWLQAIDDSVTRTATTAERAFLSHLGGGCAAPIAALAEPDMEAGQAALRMTGLAASPDGRHVVRVAGRGLKAEALGQELAQAALAAGARELLA